MAHMAHVYNPGYSGGLQFKVSFVNVSQDSISTCDRALRCAPVFPATQGSINRMIVVQADLGIKWDPISNNQIQMGWEHGSSDRVPVWQMQSPEFKLQYCSPTPRPAIKKSWRKYKEVSWCVNVHRYAFDVVFTQSKFIFNNLSRTVNSGFQNQKNNPSTATYSRNRQENLAFPALCILFSWLIAFQFFPEFVINKFLYSNLSIVAFL
jgi:hypothetical protein